uniref:BZIP domain-containing protein n=1 Tax=Spongospora subterranea TaxID=70186 RepID=A0A0H5RLV0_9EUKA|eukprot:CRZ09704.1 hypothetical protein [Spongospora subterranea]
MENQGHLGHGSWFDRKRATSPGSPTRMPNPLSYGHHADYMDCHLDHTSSPSKGQPSLIMPHNAPSSSAINISCLPKISSASSNPPALPVVVPDKHKDVLQKMANKAERARRSRRKRKAYVSDLETQLQSYSQQLRLLASQEAQLSHVINGQFNDERSLSKNVIKERQFETDLERCKTIHMDTIRAIQEQLQRPKHSPTSQPDSLSTLLKTLTKNCRARENMFEEYLELMESTICFGSGNPAEALWLLCSREGDELRSHLKLSDAQTMALDQFRLRFAELSRDLSLVLHITTGLRSHCREMVNARGQEIERMIQITGDIETCRIINWVEKETWFMELLDSLFDQYIASSLD